MALILLVVTCLLLHSKHEKELAEKKLIDDMIAQAELTEARAEVLEVQEPVPDVIAPREDSYYEDLELLARVLHCENFNEVDGEEACWKTGSVIINRINSPNYPDTLEGVIYQEGQYDCLKNLYKEEPTDIEWEVAAELLSTGGVIPEEVVYAAEFRQGSGVHDQEGRTIYCYE